MAGSPKPEQNTGISAIDPIKFPATRSIIDRYVLASHWCKDKVVLDAACGHGFGSLILTALGAKKVMGLDLDEQAIDFAEEKYFHLNWEYSPIFTVVDLTEDLTVENEGMRNKFDVVVSLETFEHVPKKKVKQMLENFKFLCKPGGKILITTPFRRTEKFVYEGGTHLWEYDYEEFIIELKKVWNLDNIQVNWLVEKWVSNQNFVTLFSKDPKDIQSASLFFAEITNDK